MLSDPIQVTLKVTTVLDRLGIPYLIGGSLASAVYGIVRATMDADLVADIHSNQIQDLVSALKNEFYIDADMILNAVKRTSSFNLIHLETMFKVDVFLIKQRPFDSIQMKRRILQLIGSEPEEKAYFSTPEDIILAKLEWFRAGGETSERQWRDILGVLALQGERLDFQYLQEWAEKLGIRVLLEKAISEQNSPL